MTTPFQDLNAETFEGALMTDPEKTRGIILSKAGTTPKRRRFTIGHELGHFLVPSHKGNRQCTSADLRETRRETIHQRQEAEANRFSAGLLMPRPWFIRDMRAMGEADVTHIQRLADVYNVSLEACANRYVELIDDYLRGRFHQGWRDPLHSLVHQLSVSVRQEGRSVAEKLSQCGRGPNAASSSDVLG
jgi:Zn-dependent peptidase ImmA (M78 family)